MLRGLFPEDVETAWGDPLEVSTPLFPEEEALVARAVDKRRREFAKGRECARQALLRLGRPRALLLTGNHREPLWPSEFTGSITHTERLCAVAVARSKHYRGLGIDAEPAETLRPEVVERVCRGDDRRSWNGLASLEAELVPRLVFSVKEAIYKCQFPITKTFLGFEDVGVELGNGVFVATLRVDAPPFRAGSAFTGRWCRTERHLLAGAWLPAGDN